MAWRLIPATPEALAQAEAERQARPPSPMEALKRGLTRGVYGTGASMAGFGGLLGIPGALELGQELEGRAAAVPPAAPQDITQNPEALLSLNYWLEQTGQALPSVATAHLAGSGTMKLGELLGIAKQALPTLGALGASVAGAGLEGGGAYVETGDPLRSAAFGGATALINMLGGRGVYSGAYGPVRSGMVEGMQEFLEEPAKALIFNRPLGEALRAGVNVIPGSFASGALASGLTERARTAAPVSAPNVALAAAPALTVPAMTVEPMQAELPHLPAAPEQLAPGYINRLANRVYELSWENEGATVSPTGESMAGRPGFAVASYPMAEQIIQGRPLTRRDLINFITDNWDVLLNDPDAYIGTWHNRANDSWYLDISHVMPEQQDAEQRARNLRELSIYDLGQFREIWLDRAPQLELPLSTTAAAEMQTPELTPEVSELTAPQEWPTNLVPVRNFGDAQRELERARRTGHSYRRLGYATILHEAGDGIAVKHHGTDIVTFYPDGSVSVNTGGWWTRSTLMRIREYTGFSLRRDRNGEHVIVMPDATKFPFHDMMRFMPDAEGHWRPVEADGQPTPTSAKDITLPPRQPQIRIAGPGEQAPSLIQPMQYRIPSLEDSVQGLKNGQKQIMKYRGLDSSNVNLVPTAPVEPYARLFDPAVFEQQRRFINFDKFVRQGEMLPASVYPQGTARLAGALDSLLAAGYPKVWLSKLKVIGYIPAVAHGMHSGPGQGVFVSLAYVIPDAPATLFMLRMTMAHEIAHAADVMMESERSIYDYYSTKSPRFRINRESLRMSSGELDLDTSSFGDVMREITEVYKARSSESDAKSALGRHYAYPLYMLDDLHSYLIFGQQRNARIVQSRIALEAWAQSVALYMTFPDAMRQYLPVTYAMVNEVINATRSVDSVEQAEEIIRHAFQAPAT